MNTQSTKEKKILINKVYKKNIKARGQTLQISKNLSKKKQIQKINYFLITIEIINQKNLI